MKPSMKRLFHQGLKWISMLMLVLLNPVGLIAAQENFSADEWIEARALVVSRVRTIMSAEVDARVKTIQVDMGDRFKQGQTLVLLSQETYRAHHDRARAELKSAKLSMQSKEKMHALHSISDLEVAQSRAQVEQKQSVMRLQSYYLKCCSIDAPFSGRVVQRLVRPYQFVTAGTPLLEIIDDRSLQVQAFLPSWVGVRISAGHPFILDVEETGKQYQGRVLSIGAVVDENSQMIEIRGNIASFSPDLLAGMSGVLRFERLTSSADGEVE